VTPVVTVIGLGSIRLRSAIFLGALLCALCRSRAGDYET
jgi:hypothetical protein